MGKMTDKQKRFCDEYLIDLNATQAAIRAGYSPKYANTNAFKLLQITALKDYICKRMQEKDNNLIASQDEILIYLTSVLRGESQATEIVVEGTGEGCSEARTVLKAPSEKERLKAAELLGKRYGIYADTEERTARIEQIKANTERIKRISGDDDTLEDGVELHFE